MPTFERLRWTVSEGKELLKSEATSNVLSVDALSTTKTLMCWSRPLIAEDNMVRQDLSLDDLLYVETAIVRTGLRDPDGRYAEAKWLEKRF